jgi:hypothetical protein
MYYLPILSFINIIKYGIMYGSNCDLRNVFDFS